MDTISLSPDILVIFSLIKQEIKKEYKKNLILLTAKSRKIIHHSSSSLQIPYIKIATQEDCGKGIMDCSLRGRLQLAQELLTRIGFDRDVEAKI